MTAAAVPLPIEQYADWLIQFTWRNPIDAPVNPGGLINLSGYTAKMQIRDYPGGTLLQDLNTLPASLGLGGILGTITAFIPGATTGAYTWTFGYYDLTAISGSGNVYRVSEGPVVVRKGVSH